MEPIARVASRTERDPEPVYNLEVDADHCYRVGERGLLVHNASTDSASSSSSSSQEQPDHVFARGYGRSLGTFASQVSCAWPELATAFTAAQSDVQTPPFDLTVTRSIPRPDQHSIAFSAALDGMRRAIQSFIDAAATQGNEAARRAHSASLRSAWSALVNAVEDAEVVQLVSRGQQRLVSQGRQTLMQVKLQVELVMANA